VENCHGYLYEKIGLIQPRVVCTLGNFATKLLRADQTGITRVRGRDEVKVVGTRAVRLLPLLHPAAALYTRSMLDVLREDFARIPELLALPLPDQPVPEALPEPVVPEPELAAEEPEREPEVVLASQLGLF
jgi:DNA polymerase